LRSAAVRKAKNAAPAAAGAAFFIAVVEGGVSYRIREIRAAPASLKGVTRRNGEERRNGGTTMNFSVPSVLLRFSV
jgi:hypothetical protein